MAEPVRLNPNQFLSHGRRKVPNRVYAWVIQSVCGWGEDDCAIMSFLISFCQADGQACSVGLVLEGCLLLPGMAGWAQRQIPCLSRVSQEKTPGQNPELRGHWQKEMRCYRESWKMGRQRDRGRKRLDYEAVHCWAKNQALFSKRSGSRMVFFGGVMVYLNPLNNLKLAMLEHYL